ncbi:AMP-binding protein [Sediminitomix flava]|uniref:Acyl-CoA synthetase (AMP-forming)/AMP-acid ligase II n=1 Tax=Sediminitomix flava TaxID=379075 RepID=A0A315YZM1_SEDFL|nr:AMP-binding protein [Sediminitomix flava]PWJ35035.1 acyl-CoA synthetase (AMP-forming)/AMP-acid ligase II [Sediminitomix flava]
MYIPFKPFYELKGLQNTELSNALFCEYIPHHQNLYFPNQGTTLKEDCEDQKQKIDKILGAQSAYEQFLKKKYRKAVYDIYACFQPFNEASKAFYPFIQKLQSELKPNDYILNVWDRSGWMTFLLAGLFPEQQIITIWEGNHDVLGYKGFQYWMEEQPNVSVIFIDLNQELPLDDKSFSLIIAPDTLHRFSLAKFLSELTRVAKEDAAIFFPHVHLGNTQPEPFFERGGNQLHGNTYTKLFDRMESKSEWKGMIFSEPKLFVFNDFVKSEEQESLFKSDPSMEDYNALIAILPKSWQADTIQPFSIENQEHVGAARVIMNQLLQIDLHQQKVTVDRRAFDGQLDYLLERHPIYIERIKELEGLSFDSETAQILFLAERAYTLQEISTKLQISLDKVISVLSDLEMHGLLQVLPMSEKGILLQNYLMTQKLRLPHKRHNLADLWQSTLASYAEQTALYVLEDESELSYIDCEELVQLIASALLNQGLQKGDRVLLSSNLHAEGVLLFWACMQLGIVFVPISPELSSAVTADLIVKAQAKMSFVSTTVFKEKNALFENSIVLDSEEEIEGEAEYFSDWLAENSEEELEYNTEILEQDTAVILYTSGSTGIPKGVVLSHGNLFRSSELLAKHFNFESEDRYFAFGGLESMSGLRNATLSALHFGSSVVIPRQQSLGNLLSLTEEVEETKATILAANPSFLRQLTKYQERVADQLQSIRSLMCTGNALSTDLRIALKDAFDLEVINYYGLTETSGICTSESEGDEKNENSIGKAVDCIAQVVDEYDRVLPQGEVGELRVFSENLMLHYDQNATQTAEVIKNSWFYTQDLALINQNGNIELLGRKKAFIKTAKEEIIYLDHLQSFIETQQEVEDVALCTNREQDTEIIHAFIVIKASELTLEEITKQTKERIHKAFGKAAVPKYIHFKEALPYSENGKLFKQKLTDEASKYTRTIHAN